MPGSTLWGIGLSGARVSPTRIKRLKILGGSETIPNQSNIAEQ